MHEWWQSRMRDEQMEWGLISSNESTVSIHDGEEEAETTAKDLVFLVHFQLWPWPREFSHKKKNNVLDISGWNELSLKVDISKLSFMVRISEFRVDLLLLLIEGIRWCVLDIQSWCLEAAYFSRFFGYVPLRRDLCQGWIAFSSNTKNEAVKWLGGMLMAKNIYIKYCPKVSFFFSQFQNFW